MISPSPFLTRTSLISLPSVSVTELLQLWCSALTSCKLDAELTDLDYEHFQLEGHASTVANMSIGTLTLDPIKFNVSSGLWGLKGLQGLVSIDGVDVLGGTQDALS